MAKDQNRLGKGLSALLGDMPDADQLRKPIGYVNKEIIGTTPYRDVSDVFRVPVEMVVPNPFQPRLSFDEEALEELATSIRNLGLIQPITVRRVSASRYQIISGERRFRACKMAGMTMIPAYVRDTNDRGMLEMAIVENIQREELDPIELAMSYERLIDECGLTQEAMADRVGKKRTSVTNTLRLLKLPAKVQHDLKEGLITVGHAKVILGMDDPAVQQQLCDLTIRGALSVRQLEDKVRDIIHMSGQPLKAGRKEFSLTEDYETLKAKFAALCPAGAEVRRHPDGKGTVTLRFASDEEAAALLSKLSGAGL